MLSYDRKRVLAASKKAEVESTLRLDKPLNLDKLGLMLHSIHLEFAGYQLTKVGIILL